MIKDLVVISLLFAFACSVNTECEHTASSFRCVKFVKAYDADTITVQIPDVHPYLGENASVRINGIDTAEMKGEAPCEKEAALEARVLVLTKLTNAKRVHLENIGREKFGRILADVKVDGKDIAKMLLDSGLATEYHGEKKTVRDWCAILKKYSENN